MSGHAHVRTIHHFAGTGGTLFARCVAALPRTVVLSEVTPGWQPPLRKASMIFMPPFPLIKAEAIQHGLKVTFEERAMIFGAQIELIQAKCEAIGKALVLRDHAHSDYCVRSGRLAPSLRQVLEGKHQLISILTVRHPVESFLAASEGGWLKAVPQFDDYCGRMSRFLDDHRGCPAFRYEDLVDDPETVVAAMADALSLSYTPEFRTTFAESTLAGHLGRGSGLDEIRPLRPRAYPAEAVEAWQQSPAWLALAERLGYPVSIAAFHAEREEKARAYDASRPEGGQKEAADQPMMS